MAGVPTIDARKFLKVEEDLDTRKGTPFSSSYTRTYQRKFLVVTNDRQLGAGYVCGAPGIPRPWAVYQSDDGQEFDLFAVLVSYDCSRLVVDGHFHWTVICNYSTEVPEEGVPDLPAEIGRVMGGVQNEPWTRPPVIRWDWEETTWSPPVDLDGRAFLNSARQPFSPPPSFPVARLILVVEQNELFFDRIIASRYAYAVNSDVFLGALPGTAQCMPIRSEPRNLGTLPYFKNTYRVKFGLPKHLPANGPAAVNPFLTDKAVADVITDLQSFQPEILDQGYCRLAGVGQPNAHRPIPVFRPGGTIPAPVLLDGAGNEVLPNADGRLIPTFIKFRVFQSMPFAAILGGGVF
jgi:hypothetical protein